jgi:hypothetical protein
MIDSRIIDYGRYLMSVCRGTVERGEEILPAAIFFRPDQPPALVACPGDGPKEHLITMLQAFVQQFQANAFMFVCGCLRLRGSSGDLPDLPVRELAERGYGLVEDGISVEIQTPEEDFSLYQGYSPSDGGVLFLPVQELYEPGRKHGGAFRIL